MSRPFDHIESGRGAADFADIPETVPMGGGGNRFVAAVRRAWAWLTSMRTAILLLLLLAIAAVPGSLVPQRSSDPNGVTQYFANNPDTAPTLDQFGMFDVYSSWWFSAIYLLLFVSLIGCILPRTTHHIKALRARPPKTPARLARLDAYATLRLDARWVGREEEIIDAAQRLLAARRYRTERYETMKRVKTPASHSVSAERGYLRETGNLLFHIAMLGMILVVGLLSGFNWHGQRVLVEGQAYVNGLVSYSSFTPGRFFTPSQIPPFGVRLDDLSVKYETENPRAIGLPLDYTANVTIEHPGKPAEEAVVKVNQPLRRDGIDTYLLANGYAPTITVRDAAGREVFHDSVIFIPQDGHLTSTGVVKVPDGLAQQVGFIGFFYPTAVKLDSGAYTSNNQDLLDPLLTFNVYAGDLGLDDGVPKSVYKLDTENMQQIAGRNTDVPGIELRPGQTQQLPNGLGSISLDSDIPRYASFDVHRDITQLPMSLMAALAIGGLIVSLLVPRRRAWVKAQREGDGVLVEFAGLARGEDPRLAVAINELVDASRRELVALNNRS